MNFYKIDDIDFSKLKFSRTKNVRGRRFILAYFEKKSFGLILPKLRIPFDSRINQYNQLEINVSLGNDKNLISKLKKIDEQMEVFALENEWFEPGTQGELTPMVNDKKKDFPPIVKIKVPNNDGMIKTKFFDNNKKRITVNDEQDVLNTMTKGTYIQTAIECVGVWFNDQRYGLTWKTVQVKVESQENNTDDYLFCSDTDDAFSDAELLIDD